MRIPRHFRDRNPLRDEPFASQFLLRSVTSESRSRTDKFDVGKWTENLIQAIKQDARPAAREWLKYAFCACPLEDGTIQERAAQIVLNNENIQIFIRFYWDLFEQSGRLDEDQVALRFLEKERSSQGYLYRLEENRHADGQPLPQSKRNRRSSKRVRKSFGDDAYDAEASEGEDDTASKSYGCVAAVLNDVSSLDNFSDAPQLGQVGAHITADNASSAHPKQREEHQESALLGIKRKAISDGLPSPTQLSPAEDNSLLVPPEHEQDTAMNEDSVLSSLSELTDSGPEIVDVPATNDTTRIPANSSGRPRRAASNIKHLSYLAKDMSKYDEEVRRGAIRCGWEDDASSDDMLEPPRPQLARRTAPVRPQLAKRSTPFSKPPKQRKQKMGAKPGPQLGTMTVHREVNFGALSDPSPGAVHPSLCSPAASSSSPIVKPITAKKPSKYAGKGSRRRSGGDLPNRPEKRSRNENVLVGASIEYIPIDGGMFAQPTLPGESLESTESPSEGRREEQPVPLAVNTPRWQSAPPPRSPEDPAPIVSSDAGQATVPKLPKRSRSAFESTNRDGVKERSHNKSSRVVAPLPKRRKGRRAVPQPTKPSRIILPQQPNCLTDVDSIVQDAASNALFESAVQASRITAPADNWAAADGGDGPDVSPDSSDDEIPLREVIAAKNMSDDEVDVPLAVVAAAKRGIRVENDIASHPDIIPPAELAPPPLQAEPYTPPVSTNPPWVSKPRLHVRPQIWAESRQEVCESFERFRSYQGGVYFLKDMVKGYLLGGFAASRDLFAHDGRLIISHGGGKAESIHSQKGVHKSQEAADQLEGDKSVRALLNTHAMQRPLALLVDDKYSLFPFDLAADGYTYVVLGFYRIAHAWAEEQPAQNASGSVVRYKFAFQWCDEQGTPWWMTGTTFLSSPCGEVQASSTIPDTATSYESHLTPVVSVSSDLDERSSHNMPDTKGPGENNTISSHSPERYADEGPVHMKCTTCNQSSPLVYAEHWMCLHRKCPMFWRSVYGNAPTKLTYAQSFVRPVQFVREDLEDLRPSLPAVQAEDGITTTPMFCKGWHCRVCGRLSSRYMWEYWHCKHCGEKYRVDGRVRDPKEFWTQPSPQDFTNHIVAPDSGIIALPMRMCKVDHARWGQCHTYILPHNRGRIHLICSPPLARQAADGAFRDYQMQAAKGDLLFRRWPLRAHKCRGTLLTNYFSQNSGEPYQYVGGTDNTVPWDRAPSAVRDALELIRIRMKMALSMDANFNEVLSAAYMERQKMAFHSDAERGLGPTIASLSLGSGAYMYFRLLGRYSDKKGQGCDRNALTLYLRHGDVVVMEGADTQTFYEHTVVPVNFRIAATARSIDNRNH
ncbi:hypothetical protein DAEQUDRAFT_730349 [Daedalea quercina L-15889]|uniref:Fe2OG dioxygenase domain-containing protein n=1 Tax=Daedalea quercina L-15889 TaxID=1314783 RepID=A0A165N0V7_9APHY|nr:hypothetical protein DAEQUDRAFT_730349 [Daedalea quercina L-15889]